MSKISNTTFQQTWKVQFDWVQETLSPKYAKCKLCKKDIFIQSMGKSALTSHAKSKKHNEIVVSSKKLHSLKTFYDSSKSVPAQSSGCLLPEKEFVNIQACSIKSQDISGTSSGTLDKYKLKDNVTEAEILWCLYCVTNHSSLRTSADSIKLMKRMFPDSKIAAEMKLGKDKVSYSTVYGLAPYFRSELKSYLRDVEHFVVGFDESLNKVAQKQQMDITVRFWNNYTNRVNERYITSVFLFHSRAEDLLDGLKAGLSGIDLNKIVQLSMDGPNVNMKLHRLLARELSDNNGTQLLNIGTCGLHILNVAFKTGIKKTKWGLMELFRALYYLFKDSPARRGVYTAITGSTEFPLKFFSIRWLENIKVAERAEATLANVTTYVHAVKQTENEPACSSFQVISKAVEDKLLPARLAFFKSLAEELQPFLEEFQSKTPMAPFLYESLLNIVRNLMEKIVKGDVMKNTYLHKIDLMKKEDSLYVNLKNSKNIDLGYATRSALRKCKNVTDKDILLFRQDCRTCIQFLILKMLERSPLKFSLTEALTFLNPKKIGSAGYNITHLMSTAFDIILSANILPASTLQTADREFRQLLSEPGILEEMQVYSRETRLDDFWVSLLSRHTQTDNILRVVKLLLPLSHGNANLERGFSVNKGIIVENLKEESLIATRLVYDSILDAGGIDSLKLTRNMILSMRNAHSRWKNAISEEQNRISSEQNMAALKRKAEQEAKELELKKAKILLESQKEIIAIEEKIKDLRKK